MLFSSLTFITIFLPSVLIGYYAFSVLFKCRSIQNVFLILVSLLFYAWGEPRFVLVMLFSIFINYLLGLSLDWNKKSLYVCKLIIVVTVIFNLSWLIYFKYINFLIDNVNYIFDLSWPARNVMLPIGISFFTFQAMSYVFDIYRDRAQVQKNPLNVALYISFFPQLIAGPIVRYETIANQINARVENWDMFAEGVRRFIIGFGKKVLLANNLALIADKAFSVSDYSHLSASFAFLGAVAYTLQIYYDFSGYSDMAIGLGRMFGFRFLENFNYPYISKSISEFWRRWHISLSSWFRDYVYIPLGGSRVSRKRTFLNLFVVWLLTGIWHGAGWNFPLWGMLFFVLIVFEKWTGIATRKMPRVSRICYQIFTLGFIVGNWVIFRADNITHALHYLQSMLGLQGNHLIDAQTILYIRENSIFLLAAIIFAVPIGVFLKNRLEQLKAWRKFYPAIIVAENFFLLLLFGVSLTYLAKGSYNPFIYFNF